MNFQVIVLVVAVREWCFELKKYVPLLPEEWKHFHSRCSFIAEKFMCVNYEQVGPMEVTHCCGPGNSLS